MLNGEMSSDRAFVATNACCCTTDYYFLYEPSAKLNKNQIGSAKETAKKIEDEMNCI